MFKKHNCVGHVTTGLAQCCARGSLTVLGLGGRRRNRSGVPRDFSDPLNKKLLCSSSILKTGGRARPFHNKNRWKTREWKQIGKGKLCLSKKTLFLYYCGSQEIVGDQWWASCVRFMGKQVKNTGSSAQSWKLRWRLGMVEEVMSQVPQVILAVPKGGHLCEHLHDHKLLCV